MSTLAPARIELVRRAAAYWRGVYARWWAPPTVEQRQRLEDARLQLAARQSAEEIARALAWGRVWMPGDAEVGPPGLIGVQEWSRSTALGDDGGASKAARGYPS